MLCPYRYKAENQVISKLLSGAIKLYLRSQVDRIEELQVKIVGKSKQILQGYIPEVFLSCDRAVYQGLHLSQIKLKGADIAVNLPEVIKKQPLKLVEPLFVKLQLKLNAADLQASLDSDLLQSGLLDFWQIILAAQDTKELTDLEVEWESVAIANETLNLLGIYRDALGQKNHLALTTGISLANPHTLYLSPLKINSNLSQENISDRLEIDLGKDVYVEQLAIESQQIICSGKIKVNN